MYEPLHIPASCCLDKPVFKKLFYEHGALSRADKKLFSEKILKIIWRFSLNPSNCNIKPYKDSEREYGEIEIMEVQLQKKGKEKHLAETIMQVIPYPMLLFFVAEQQYQIWVAHQCINQVDPSKNTLKEFIHSPWLSDNELLCKLSFTKLHNADFFTLYSDAVDTISIYNAAQITHKAVETGQEARALTERIAQIDNQLTSLRAKLKKETQFNRKVELNLEIKKLEKERKEERD